MTALFASGLHLTTEGFFDWLAATYKPPETYTKLSRSQRSDRDLGFSLVAGYTLRDGRRSGSLSLKNITTDVVDRLFDELLIVHEPVGAIKRGRIGGLLIVGARGTRPPGCLGSPGSGDLTYGRHVTRDMIRALGYVKRTQRQIIAGTRKWRVTRTKRGDLSE